MTSLAGLAPTMCTAALALCALMPVTPAAAQPSPTTTLQPPTACLNDLECDDGAFCNGSETCDPVAGCQPGSAPVCNDGIGCTADGCSNILQSCIHTPVDLVCDDENLCNGAETCDVENDCVATPAPDCNDGNPCTQDSCDAVSGCAHAPRADGTECSDGDACNGLELCQSGTCQNAAAPVCDDGLFCNGLETCDAVSGCVAGLAPDCSDAVACTVDTCDEGSDACVRDPDNGQCDNGAFCDGLETCDAAAGCLPGAPADCDDGINCTVDVCDEGADVCAHAPDDSACSNGDFCDGFESCDRLAGCSPGTPRDCDDGVDCTVDECDEATLGCVNTADDGACANGAFCDGVETCDALAGCQPGTSIACDDGVGCTADACNEALGSCINTAVDAVCDDRTVCNGDETCDPVLDCLAGVPLDCADGDPCTGDACDPASGCSNPPLPDGSPCDDGDVCNGVASCNMGSCVAGAPPACDDGQFCNGEESCDPTVGCIAGRAVVCDDGINCTVDSCNETLGTCSRTPDHGVCDNLDACDGIESCADGLGCVGGTPLDCDDGNPCTVDLCSASGGCSHQALADGTSCDDGNLCNGIETCQLATCTAGVALDCDDGVFCNGMETCDTLFGCGAGTAPNCNDGVGCTVDSCDEIAGVCAHTPNAMICDNGLFCDGVEICDPAVDCLPAAVLPCDDGVSCTTDTCNEATGSCASKPADALCDDGMFCNGDEACDPLLGCQGGAPACEDGIGCTVDSCNEATNKCSNSPDDLACLDGAFCNGIESCDPALGCVTSGPPTCDDGVACTVDSCDAGIDACVGTPNDADCADGDACNGEEICDAVLDCMPGTPPVCDDSLFCNGDETCDSASGCVAGTPVDCDDGVSCTIDDCDEAAGMCTHTPSNLSCNNGLFCDGPETCDATLGCQAGVAPDCNDAIACTIDACDEGADGCAHTPDDSLCVDNDVCDGTKTCQTGSGCVAGTPLDCDDGNGCTTDGCNPVTGCSNAPITDGLGCEDGNLCTTGDSCQGGSCTPGSAVVCDDANVCTTDGCDAAVGCTMTPVVDGTSCADADVCDGAETCQSGNCAPGTPLLCDNGVFCDGEETCDSISGCLAGSAPCEDGVGCTFDVCNEADGSCLNSPDDLACLDGVFCNGVEFCDDVSDCMSGTEPSCDDGVSCTSDACDALLDACENDPHDAICQDGNACNGAEVCDVALGCQMVPDLDCDDGNSCTEDTCDESGGCVHTPLADLTLCDDGDVCTQVDECFAGECVGSAPLDCDDASECTIDTCDPELGCENTPVPDGTDCADGDACNGDETCAAGTCEAGIAIVCDDALFCNGMEMCDPVDGSCSNPPPPCDDGVSCTRDTCNEATNMCTNTPDDSACADPFVCNGAEACDPINDCMPGAPPTCDDGVGCTIDSCDDGLGGCVNMPESSICDDDDVCDGTEICDPAFDCVEGVPLECSDGLTCTQDNCVPSSGCTYPPVIDGTACADGNACTSNDTCLAGSCAAGPPVVCDDGEFCNGEEGCDAVLGCQPGTPRDCGDGVSCTTDACDEADDVCTHDPVDDACANGKFCDGVEICDPVSDCQPGTPVTCDDGVGCTVDTCDEVAGACQHSPSAPACDNSDACDGEETCDPTLDCQPGTPPICDDTNVCTADSCLPTTGCVNAPLSDGTACDDASLCNGNETCQAGACTHGPAPDCDDAEPCTLDSCDPVAGCLNSAVADGVDCADGNVCNGNESCLGGVCQTGTALVCDDTMFCNGKEVCDEVAGCQPGDDPCSDGVECTVDACNEASDECQFLPDDLACMDGEFCNGEEVCDEVDDCVSEGAPDCSDAIACTFDSCNEATDMCENVPDNARCDDADVCNGAETCSAMSGCVGGTPLACSDGLFCNGAEECDRSAGCQVGSPPCDDGVDCTVDRCDELANRCNNVPDHSVCDDGLFCDGAEKCDSALGCTSMPPVNCGDGIACTHDSCNEATDACDNIPDDEICQDNDACNGAEICDMSLDCGPGTPLDCDDGEPCTTDSCDSITGCDNADVTDGTECDDADVCTGPDVCTAGVCGGPAALDCNDDNPCTVDVCDPTRGCTNELAADGTLCEDGNLCTVMDLCVAGICEPGPAADCSNGLFCDGAERCDELLGCVAGIDPCEDGIGCTADRCNELDDTCSNLAENDACDDAVFCNGAETCDTALGCQPGAPPACNDGVDCTDDSCDAGTDACVNAAVDTNCDDGLFCNGVETCDVALGCQSGAPPDPDDGVACTADTCDESTDEIVNTPNDANCSDGEFCNGAETCDPALDCQTAAPLDCDDGLDCTADVCDPASGCVNLPVDAACDDGVDCTLDVCDPPDGCTNLPVDAGCADGLFCNGDETCDAALGCQPGTPPNVDDGVDCTTDSCDESSDDVVNTTDDANCADGTFCNGVEVCDATLGCLAGDALLVDDGIACTFDFCDEATDAIVHSLDHADCDDSLFCNGAEVCDAALDCQPGTPPSGDDGIGCTLESCDEATDTFISTPSDASCDDGLFCNGVETCDDVLDCQPGTPPSSDDGVPCTTASCDEAIDAIVHKPSDALCDDGTFCNGAETCDAVLGCQPGLAPNTDDGIACTNDSCDEVADTVVNAPDDGLCANSLFCDGDETCDPVLDCQPALPRECSDGIACTDDSCNESTNACVHEPNDSLCDDGDLCNGQEVCESTTGCESGTPPDCNDDNPCTDDSCHATLGCLATANAAPCDDGAACTTGDTCTAGACEGASTCAAGEICDHGAGICIDPPDADNDGLTDHDDPCPSDPRNLCAGYVAVDLATGKDIRINANVSLIECSGAKVDCNGDVWEADYGYNQSGQAGVCNLGFGEDCVISGIDAIFGCEDEPTEDLFQCDHWDAAAPPPLEYAFDLPVGDYVVNLFFANTFTGTSLPGQRVFDIFVEGVKAYEAFDEVVASSGSGIAVVRSAIAHVDDGTLEISFLAVVENPTLKAIEVLAVSGCLGDAQCDDGDVCNGVETCKSLVCVAGSPPACNDANACNGLETCDPVAGCQLGTPVDCNDGIACTVDLCSAGSGTCQHIPDHASCDDRVYCNGQETCDAVLDCVVATPRDCDDGLVCTADSCDEIRGTCENVPDDAACDDGVDCTVDGCDTLNGCSNVASDAACDDDDACNGMEICDPAGGCGAGLAPECDDANPCTDDGCVPGSGCVHSVNAAPCNDGNACTVDDVCAFGSCTSGSVLDCDDGDACTLDECLAASGCSSTSIDCDDANLCTVDSCSGGAGCENAPVADGTGCDDGDPCTGIDTCQGGTCQSPAPLECDDGLFCNGDETCVAGSGCVAGALVDCDDDVSCTDDLCDETFDDCFFELGHEDCDNGLFCDGVEVCDPVLDCQPGTPPPCDDGVDCTVDSCDELGGCTSVADDGLCDDALFCNGAETCDAVLGCAGGTAIDCEDGIDCTLDLCVEVADTCDNVVTCTGNDICDPVSGQCEEVDPRVCIPAATYAPALFQGAMTTGAAFAGGDDSDPAADSLVGLLAFADSASSSFSGGSGDQVTYTIDLPSAGPWYVWGRFYYPGAPASNQANSFLLSVDGGAQWKLGNNKDFFQRWHWDGDGSFESGPPAPLSLGFLAAGTHHVTVEKREVTPIPPRLDVLCFSPDPTPAPTDLEALALLGAGAPSSTLPAASTTTTTMASSCFVDSDCDDGLFCNGAEVCDALLGCIPGTPPACGDSVACTTDVCNEIFDICLHTANHVLCDDGDVCNGSETCSAAGCMPGSPPDCDDANPCTDDVCTPVGGCAHVANFAPCDDGISCTADFCASGTCVGDDTCPIGSACSPSSGLCEMPLDSRVWIAAAVDPTAAFSGTMTTDTSLAGGGDADPLADSLLPSLVFAAGGGNDFSGGSGDEVSYIVDIPTTGIWYLWGRFYYPGTPGSNDANSFFVRVDGGAPMKLGNNKDFFQKWHWDGDGTFESGAPVAREVGLLGAGVHEIVIEKREVTPIAPRLDVLMLTQDPFTAPTDAEARFAFGLP